MTDPDVRDPARHLRSISLKNILSVGEDEIEVKFGSRLTLLFGENGTGKSAIGRILGHLFPKRPETFARPHRSGLHAPGLAFMVPRLPKCLRHNFDPRLTSEVCFRFHGSYVSKIDLLEGEGRGDLYIPATFVRLRWAPEAPGDAHDLRRSLLEDAGDAEGLAAFDESQPYAIEIDSDYGSPETPRTWTIWRSGEHRVVAAGAHGLEWPDRWQGQDGIDFNRCDDEARVTFVGAGVERHVLEQVLEWATLQSPRTVRTAGSSTQRTASTISLAGVDLWSPYVVSIALVNSWREALPASPVLEASAGRGTHKSLHERGSDRHIAVKWRLAGASEVPWDALSLGEQRMAQLLSEVVRHAATSMHGGGVLSLPWDPMILEEPEAHLHAATQGAFMRATLGARSALKAAGELTRATVARMRDGTGAPTESDAIRDEYLDEISGVEMEKELVELLVILKDFSHWEPGPIVMETHSEALLRAALDAVADGRLSADVELSICVFRRDDETGNTVVDHIAVSPEGSMLRLWPATSPGPDSAAR